jgi:hypothetical protein
MRKLCAAIAPLVVCFALVAADAARADCTFRTLGKTLILEADCETNGTVWIPDGFTMDGRGRTITAVETTPGGWKGAVVQAEGTSANVKNLTIATDDLACACKAGADRLAGIRFDGAGGKISGNSIWDIKKGGGCGCQEGIGIEIRNAPFDGTGTPGGRTKVDITNNFVPLYQKGGIAVLGNVDAKVHKNSTAGLMPIAYIAQNGIQMSYGAAGVVHSNLVDGNWYEGDGWASTGILVFETDGVRVQDNDVVENQIGIGLEAWCWIAPSADDNDVTGNRINEAEWGVTVAAYSLNGYTGCDPSASRNRVNDNVIATTGGEIGVYVGTAEYYGVSGYTPTASRNEVRGNEISGFDTDILDEGEDTRKALPLGLKGRVEPFEP